MNSLSRVLHYVKYEYRPLAVAITCALLVAILFSLSLAAMLPLMKVMIGEEGLHGWVNRAVVKQRSGIRFYDVPLAENLQATGKAVEQAKLRISRIVHHSPAAGIGLREQDIVLQVVSPDLSLEALPESRHRRDRLLERLARAPTGVRMQITVEHDSGQQETVELRLEEKPFYARGAEWLLGYVPRMENIESDAQMSRFKRDSIVLMIVLMLIATLIRCFLKFLHEYLVKNLSYRILMRFRRDAYTNAIRMPLLHFSTKGVSDTISRFVQDSNRIHTGITTLFGKVVLEPITIAFLAFCAFKINAKMTLIVLTGAPVAGFVIGQLGRKMKKATKRTLQNWSQMLGRLQESLQGIRIVKGYHQERQEEQVFEQINRKLLKQQGRVAKINAASGPLLEALGVAAASAAMIFAAFYLAGGGMSTSDFFTLVILLAAMAESGRKLGDVFPRIQAANAAAERMVHLMDLPSESEAPHARVLGRLQKNLTMRSVRFTYPEATEPALRDIELDIRAGERVAVVGPNGSGKTTLVSLIPRFFSPDSGSVQIDGEDIAQVTLESLRQQIGIVTQQTIVFNDSVGANIAYAKPDASRQEVIEAACRAYAHEFIEQLPHGYDTRVGEQGAKLSGGQLQRITIARAILRDPAILIFDEATSQIDSDSEAKIQKAILEFSAGRTSFIIAHRLSTIIHADRIVVLEAGRIAAQGKHETLIDTCPLYRQLYEMQFAVNI
ncbi:MAG: ABC transporter ATP-binding protein [Sedimentisphaerales bacterium]|nr:ABC transporter ATP-binding protein [Sedimentisphaerales bacterium]